MDNLRPYQRDALDAVRTRTVTRGVVALPTGTGKGHIAPHIPHALDTTNVLFLAHREELINQLVEHIVLVHGFGSVEVEQASRRSIGTAPMVVASVPTLAARNGRRLMDLGSNRFEAVVVDEAYHSTANSYVRLWQQLGILDGNKAKPETCIPLIGLTATPSRGDRVGLHNVFDDIIYQMTLQDAIESGWLVPIYAYTIKTQTALDNVKTRGRHGDYVESELARAVNNEERNAAVLDAWRTNAAGLKTLVFCVNIAHATEMAKWFNDAGASARWVAGTLPKTERRDAFEWFASTPGAVLTNCQLVTEGVDIPSVECVIMARPTKSQTLYAQCLGRGTRLAKGARDFEESVKRGKDRLLLLDVTDAVTDLGRQAVCIGDLFGLPFPHKSFSGDEMIEEIGRQQRAVDAAAMEAQQRQVQTLTEAVELFQRATKPVDGATLAWVRTGQILQLGLGAPENGYLTVTTDALDRWTSTWHVPRRCRNNNGPYAVAESERAVIRAAEKRLLSERPELRHLLSNRAKWRQDAPSEKQIALCTRLQIPVPPDVTKGEVSRVLDRYFSARRAGTTSR